MHGQIIQILEGSPNVSAEALIRVSEINLNNPHRSAYVNKIQTKSSRSGTFPRSGKHSHALDLIYQMSIVFQIFVFPVGCISVESSQLKKSM